MMQLGLVKQARKPESARHHLGHLGGKIGLHTRAHRGAHLRAIIACDSHVLRFVARLKEARDETKAWEANRQAALDFLSAQPRAKRPAGRDDSGHNYSGAKRPAGHDDSGHNYLGAKRPAGHDDSGHNYSGAKRPAGNGVEARLERRHTLGTASYGKGSNPKGGERGSALQRSLSFAPALSNVFTTKSGRHISYGILAIWHMSYGILVMAY